MNVKLDRTQAPAYAQIADSVAEAVSAGELAAGDRLPPERELAVHFGVSRMTLRQALDVLERRGLVVRSVGRSGGTFVAEPKLVRDLSSFAGLSEQLRRQGVLAGGRVLAATEIAPGHAAASALSLEPDERVYEIVRVRLADDLPVALERTSFPARRFPGLLRAPLERSLYELLRDRYGVVPQRAVEHLEPTVAGPAEAEILEVPQGAPLMLVERTAYDRAGEPLEFSRELFRGDRTRVVVSISAGPRR